MRTRFITRDELKRITWPAMPLALLLAALLERHPPFVLVSTSDPVFNILGVTAGWLGFLALILFALPFVVIWGAGACIIGEIGFLAYELAFLSPTIGVLAIFVPVVVVWRLLKSDRPLLHRSIDLIFFRIPEFWTEIFLDFVNVTAVPDMYWVLKHWKDTNSIGKAITMNQLVEERSLRESAARVAELVGIHGVPTFLEDYEGWFDEVLRRIQIRSQQKSRNEALVLLDQATAAYTKLVALKRTQGELERVPLEDEVAREELLLKLERARAERHGKVLKGEHHKAAIQALQPASPKSKQAKKAEWAQEMEDALSTRVNRLEAVTKAGERLKKKYPRQADAIDRHSEHLIHEIIEGRR
jgi:hypothetical protein